jgi:hypothetical protein
MKSSTRSSGSADPPTKPDKPVDPPATGGEDESPKNDRQEPHEG